MKTVLARPGPMLVSWGIVAGCPGSTADPTPRPFSISPGAER